MRRERPPFWFEEFEERIRSLQEEFENLLEEMWRPIARVQTSFPVDVAETKDSIIVRADLPGFKKEEIRILAREGELIIEAEKKEEKREEGENFLRRERRVGKVRRAISLPYYADTSKARARFEDGVLEVVIPKKEGLKEREIEIE
jgi:HSP20 family protein